MTNAYKNCSLCGAEAPPGGHPHREVSGWERVRAGGGLHALTDRQETGRVACGSCVAEMKAGIPTGQQRLLQ